MLHLKCETPPAWLDYALAHLDEVLVDHAHCEKKATATALSLLSSYPDRPALASAMASLAEEEAGHLRMVIEALHARGLKLSADPGDPYAQALLANVRGGGDRLMDRLLVSACIEARSCERLKLLSENVPEPSLRTLYTKLFAAEANHFGLFANLADELFSRDRSRARLDELLDAEAAIVRGMPVRAAVH